MWLFIAFVAVPIIEIALFIQVGGILGLWPTLGIVVLTAIAGAILLRAQGAVAMQNLRRSFQEMRDPAEPLAHGAMILVAGVVLLTPGFFTDALGLALLLPPVRQAILRYVSARVRVVQFSADDGGQRGRDPSRDQGAVIDGEFLEVGQDGESPSPPKTPTHRPSGWTKH